MATSLVPYRSTTDPRKLASNQRALIYQQGQQLSQQDLDRARQEQTTRQGTADYLGGIEDPLARGYGGYNADELSQIRMTPEQQQQIVTSAGISAAAPTQAAVQAAERASAAAGGNPAALAAYRARAAQQVAANAGDAMTNARVAASNAAAQRAENIGQTRIGQQQKGLDYYQKQNEQANQNAQNEYQRALQTYSTQTGGTNTAAETGLRASQTPTTFDKVMGGVSGALKFIDEGDVMSDDSTPAVVGENGPEKVVNLQDGDIGAGSGMGEPVSDGNPPSSPPSPGNPAGTAPRPWWRRVGSALKTQFQNQQQAAQAAPPAPEQGAWNPVDTYRTLGQAGGQAASKIGRLFFAEGGVNSQGKNGIFTKPTRVNLHRNEAVVPLNYRATAKARPSLASLPPAQIRGVSPYRGVAKDLR